ncbi:unnamed protein product, partial [Ilex paraguariensis]
EEISEKLENPSMAKDQEVVLTKLDDARTQLFHFKAIVIAGMGFLTDAYDLFCISLVTKLLGRIYYHVDGSSKPGSLPPNVAAAVNGVALCGTLAGQLFFGWLGDKMGRKRVYGITLMLMMFCPIASRLSFGSSSRAVMGVGILLGGLVALTVSSIFRAKFDAPPYSVDPLGSTPAEADYVWRIILMLGAVPAALTYYWRMKLPETARYTALVAKNATKASEDMSKVLNVEIQAEKEKPLDIKSNSFGQNLFQKDIFSAIGWLPKAPTMSALDELYKIARAQSILAFCGTFLGYWFTVFLIDRIGRFSIQLLGFFFMTVFMFALAIPYNHWIQKGNHAGFLVMYGLTFFFANFGPNSTTFVVPAEVFPARLRSTCHGISAAAGKAGAIVGAFGFLYAAQNQDKSKADPGYPAGIGMRYALMVLGVINVLGLCCTFLVPETKGKSLEEMSRENEEEEQQTEETHQIETV